MNKVYVTQETDVDFSAAAEYGEVVFLAKGDISNMPNSLRNEETVTRMRYLLRGFDVRDWVVITGSPYLSAMAFMILGKMGITKVQILRWDNRDLVYRILHLSIEDVVGSIRR